MKNSKNSSVALSREIEAAPERRSKMRRLDPIVNLHYDCSLFLAHEDLIRSHINFINLNLYLSTYRRRKKGGKH